MRKAGVPVSVVARTRRRVAVMSASRTSPTTAASPSIRRASSIAPSTCLGFQVSTWSRRDGQRPAWPSAGEKRSEPVCTQTTGPVVRERRPAMKSAGKPDASAEPGAPATSCSADRARPPFKWQSRVGKPNDRNEVSPGGRSSAPIIRRSASSVGRGSRDEGESFGTRAHLAVVSAGVCRRGRHGDHRDVAAVARRHSGRRGWVASHRRRTAPRRADAGTSAHVGDAEDRSGDRAAWSMERLRSPVCAYRLGPLRTSSCFVRSCAANVPGVIALC